MVWQTNLYADQYFQQKGGKDQLPKCSPARNWKPIGREDMTAYIDPMWLRPFQERCGVLLHDPEATPQEIFRSLLPPEAIDILVWQANLYADQYFQQKGGKDQLPKCSPARNWKPIGKHDMMAFIAIIMLMGIIRLPSYKLHWLNCWMIIGAGAEESHQ